MARKKKELRFEEALERLKKIVAELESGEGSLDDALERFEEGLELGRSCQELLEKTQLKIQEMARGEETAARDDESQASTTGEVEAAREAAAGRQGSFLDDTDPDAEP